MLDKDAIDLLNRWKSCRDNSYIRQSWDQTFLNIAIEVSKRSHDPQTQVGCVLVNESNEIVATGFNGFIRSIEDKVLPNLRPDKYEFFVHSEHNAILNCARQGRSTLGLTCYVTGHPCHKCIQYLWQAGIHKVKYRTVQKIISLEEYDEISQILLELTEMKIIEI